MLSVLILADIEGTTGCLKRSDSQLFNKGWARACHEASKDAAAVCSALLSHGVSKIRVKDFHRTGYNLIRSYFAPEVELDQGFKSGPAVGIGNVEGFDAVMLLGLHAASGTDGFIPHTLTSKFAKIEVNGKILTEAELFAASVAPFGLPPIFFSGDRTACFQASEAIPGLPVFEVNKPLESSPEALRTRLAGAALDALKKAEAKLPSVFCPKGPFSVKLTMRDGEKAAEKLRKIWNFSGSGSEAIFETDTPKNLYWQLIRAAYLVPFAEKYLEPALKLNSALGYISLMWAKRVHKTN